MDKTIGFLGCGNMAQAIIRGLLASQQAAPHQLLAWTPNTAKLQRLGQQLGFTPLASASELAQADIVIGAVKPNVILKALSEMASALRKETVVVSVAAGVTLDQLAGALGYDRKIVRVMPNTPAAVNAGMASVTPNALVTPEETDHVLQIFRSLGKAELVPEALIHAVVSVSGSSPAYCFMLIEAMGDAAVLAGMPRDMAYQFAAQAVLGAAKMVLETGQHPGQLKDSVCSPGGTTIEAVRQLEQHGFRAAIIEAMQACVAKSQAMST